jgi:outer membrane protein assembly factor BamD
LAIADSWYREGGTRGLAQAEAECKDLIKFYPDGPEASKAKELLKKIQDARAKQK